MRGGGGGGGGYATRRRQCFYNVPSQKIVDCRKRAREED